MEKLCRSKPLLCHTHAKFLLEHVRPGFEGRGSILPGREGKRHLTPPIPLCASNHGSNSCLSTFEQRTIQLFFVVSCQSKEFEFESETTVGEEMSVSICVPGVLKDKADLQRGWGVEPRGADVSAKERLRRFYYVYNRSKVRWRCPPGGHYSTVVHASCRKRGVDL